MSDAMKRISEMARLLLACKSDISELNLKLGALKKQELHLETEDIPELMRELDMKSFQLGDGTKIDVVEDLMCGISADNRDAAHRWLRDNRFGGIIKTLITQQYGPGEIETAIRNAEAISDLTGRAAAVAETIHAGTLKAFLKEQRAKGTKIPEILFGLFPFSKAKVIPPKG